MTPLKNDGTPDKRFLKRSSEMIDCFFEVSSSPILPTKNGYVQFYFRPITVTNGIVSNHKPEE